MTASDTPTKNHSAVHRFQVYKDPAVTHITLLCWCLAGFLLDERGIKMSKSIGNVVDPRTVMLGGKDQKQVPAQLSTLDPSQSPNPNPLKSCWAARTRSR